MSNTYRSFRKQTSKNPRARRISKRNMQGKPKNSRYALYDFVRNYFTYSDGAIVNLKKIKPKYRQRAKEYFYEDVK